MCDVNQPTGTVPVFAQRKRDYPLPARPTIVFAGGGTAGHLFPGLAIAEQLRATPPAPPILFVGSGRPIERSWVEDAGFPYHAVPCRPGPRAVRALAAAVWHNFRGLLAARRLLRESACHLVVGLGGYASLPTACAALSLGIPLVLLEQNVHPGRATRLLARWARAVCVAFPETRALLPHPQRVWLTGNPLRAAFSRIVTPGDNRPRQLLILGGSGGARSLNRHVPPALARLGSLLSDWQVVHQSGEADAESTRALYARVGVSAQVQPFLHRLPQTLSASDLVVCRSGGTTLAELAALGVPAVLVPYPHAAADHQRHNADWAVATGGCACVEETSDVATPLDLRLAAAVAPLVSDTSRRSTMAAALRRAARPNAAGQVAALLRTVLTPA